MFGVELEEQLLDQYVVQVCIGVFFQLVCVGVVGEIGWIQCGCWVVIFEVLVDYVGVVEYYVVFD